MTCFSSFWSGCFGVTQKNLLKDQVGRVKWWPWCGAGHQEQPGTDLAQPNPRAQAGWKWHWKEADVNWKARVSPWPWQTLLGLCHPGECVVAKHRLISTRYSYINCKLPDHTGWDWRGMPGCPASVKGNKMTLFSQFWPCQEKFDYWDRPQKLRQG